MTVKECIHKGIFYLDGGTGSSLQARGLQPGELPELWNLTHPEEIVALGRAYYEAGSHAICTNTFGANGLKFDGQEGRPTVEEVISAAVKNAQEARRTAQGGQADKFVTLDIGPLGRLLAPLGDLPFERAVELFAQQVRAGVAAGADLILIETMNDCYETKAAVLAAKENSSLPILVSNVYDGDGKLMSGANPEAMVAMLEGLGVDAVGLNCSLGPAKMLELLPRFTACMSVPLLVKPNAGLPRVEDGRTVYDLDAAAFGGVMKEIAAAGGCILGGCCGTTPDYVKELTAATRGMEAIYPTPKTNRTVVSSYTHAVQFGTQPVLIGERINPTGKKRFKEALRANDIDYILKEGVSQQEKGVHILDVNVGLPEIDEAAMLCRCVAELQAVCDLPLQLDSTNSTAMEQAMRLYNGKPMVNSVNGKAESMEAVFPLVQKYGGLVVCLTLDEQGIPATAEGRLEIARRIVAKAAQYGIAPKDLIFDPLALTISSEPDAALVTLQATKAIKEELGVCTSLGISNISFGLPNRDFITAAFYTMALQQGLDAAIMNPHSTEVMKAYRSFMALSGQDPNCQSYIDFAQNLTVEAVAAQPTAKAEAANAEGLQGAIVKGLSGEAARLAAQALQNCDPLELINSQIVPALDVMGQGFENKTVFLPQLLKSAEAAKAAFEEVRKMMPATLNEGPAVVLATVKGDIHDIGKHSVKALLQNYGFGVIDLGKDVAPEVVVQRVLDEGVELVGLSALMTTTVPAMAETIKLLREKAPKCKVVVGGAVLTQEYADQIGADKYARNAMETVRYAQQILG
ncbi:MAG: homocysteine S-methyltransferase family protein [Oscillospiraceae bacterium]|nr:homocysteine S-methyltransferase family protein [Oscillospiraceae bacterium]